MAETETEAWVEQLDEAAAIAVLTEISQEIRDIRRQQPLKRVPQVEQVTVKVGPLTIPAGHRWIVTLGRPGMRLAGGWQPFEGWAWRQAQRVRYEVDKQTSATEDWPRPPLHRFNLIAELRAMWLDNRRRDQVTGEFYTARPVQPEADS